MKRIITSLMLIMVVSAGFPFTVLGIIKDNGSFKYIIDLSEAPGIKITFLDRSQQEIQYNPETQSYSTDFRESDTEINQFYVNIQSTYLGDLDVTFSFTPFVLEKPPFSGMPNIGYTAHVYDTTTYTTSSEVKVSSDSEGYVEMAALTVVRPSNSLIDTTWAVSFTDLVDYSLFTAGDYHAYVKVAVDYAG